ncbi:MAG: ABC transporter ATP-binding protein [Oscillospiraceae bacterium]|nr:ABC transporter ATP-binding protein [Oscillospiraceae bacterium]
MEHCLSMGEVFISFGDRPALQGLSFDVQEGEIFGFLGPSGAGKTTTIKLLTKQLRAASGEIEVLGRDIGALSMADFDQIGVLTDSSGLYERLSVWENLALFADLKGLPSSQVEDALKAVGLSDEKKKKAKALSRGMKQRLMLARAVLHKPKLLFLDEPTAALDPATTASIHKLLFSLNREGTTIFLTTHDMMEADKLCGRVAFLDKGRIVELGQPASLKLKYAHDQVDILTADGQTHSCKKSAASIKACLDGLSCGVSAIHSKEPTLEDIFLSLTGRELS